MPQRLEKLFDLGREPVYGDVDLATVVGGFAAPLPVFLCAFGSTQVAGGSRRRREPAGRPARHPDGDRGERRADARVRAAGEPAGGTARPDPRVRRRAVRDGLGGVVVQQSTEDADAEVWNLVYSDPFATRLLATGRLAFELKVGQGAKPGLGGMTVLTASAAAAVADQYAVDDAFGDDREGAAVQQPRHVHRGDPAPAGPPHAQQLPAGPGLGEAAPRPRRRPRRPGRLVGRRGRGHCGRCRGRHRLGPFGRSSTRSGCRWRSACAGSASTTPSLLVSGRIWEGSRALKCLALGATAVGPGPGRSARGRRGPRRRAWSGLVRCLELELRLLISALGKYRPAEVSVDDLWFPNSAERERDQL